MRKTTFIQNIYMNVGDSDLSIIYRTDYGKIQLKIEYY